MAIYCFILESLLLRLLTGVRIHDGSLELSRSVSDVPARDLDLSSSAIKSGCFSVRKIDSFLGLSRLSEHVSIPADELEQDDVGDAEDRIFMEFERTTWGKLVLIAGGRCCKAIRLDIRV